MLEIFLIIYLSKKLGEKLENKGRKKGWYIFGFVVTWVVFEIAGAIIGFIVFGEGSLLPYLFALLGAGLAYLLHYSYVNSLSDLNSSDSNNSFITRN